MKTIRTSQYINEMHNNKENPQDAADKGNGTVGSQMAGMSKARLKTKIYKTIHPITQQFYSDESWQGVKQVWDAFDGLDLDWNMTESYYGSGQYDKTMPPERKTWKFEINFTNQVGKPSKMYGVLVAAGGGKIDDPLSRYDITVNMG